MNEHYCLLCMGSNTNRFTQLSDARKALSEAFPDIHFGELMETEAIGSGFHSPFSVSCIFLKNTYVGIGLHIRWHKPTRIYASGYTYVRISLHVYMSLCQVPSIVIQNFYNLIHIIY